MSDERKPGEKRPLDDQEEGESLDVAHTQYTPTKFFCAIPNLIELRVNLTSPGMEVEDEMERKRTREESENGEQEENLLVSEKDQCTDSRGCVQSEFWHEPEYACIPVSVPTPVPTTPVRNLAGVEVVFITCLLWRHGYCHVLVCRRAERSLKVLTSQLLRVSFVLSKPPKPKYKKYLHIQVGKRPINIA